MTVNGSTSYLSYFNKLVDQYNNTYHCSIGKKPVNADYSALSEEIESSHKAPKFKVGDRVRVTKTQGYFQQSLHWKERNICYWFGARTNRWVHKIKDLNGEKIIGNF